MRGAIKRGTSAVRTVKKAVSNGYNKVKNFTHRRYNKSYISNTQNYVKRTAKKYRGKAKVEKIVIMPDPYDGVKEASRFLKEQGVSRNHRKKFWNPLI